MSKMQEVKDQLEMMFNTYGHDQLTMDWQNGYLHGLGHFGVLSTSEVKEIREWIEFEYR